MGRNDNAFTFFHKVRSSVYNDFSFTFNDLCNSIERRYLFR
ncbi:hypothetical protein ACQ7CU_04520 [Chryseobacterium arthrosphaerae]